MTWNNVSPSHFNFISSTGTDNVISYGYVVEPKHIALTTTWATSTTPNVKAITVFSDIKLFDINTPPASGSFNVEGIMTHEFGHWLHLYDIADSNCTHVTMFESDFDGTDYLNLDIADENAINYQYP